MAPFGRNPPQGLGVVTQGSPVEESPYSAGGWILRPTPYPLVVRRFSLEPLPFGGKQLEGGGPLYTILRIPVGLAAPDPTPSTNP